MNGHPLLAELREAGIDPAASSDVLEHVAECVACRVRMARLAQLGEVPPAAPNVVQTILDASTLVPGVSALVSAVGDVEPAAGELWRVGDDEALLVWVRKNFGDGAVDVVPVVLDVALADEYAVVVPAVDSPLDVELAVLVSLRVHVHRDTFIDRIGSLDVAVQVEEITSAIRAGRAVSSSVTAPIVSPDDDRIEYRQAMRDLLAELAPSSWTQRIRSMPEKSHAVQSVDLEDSLSLEQAQHQISERIYSASCLAVLSDSFEFGDGQMLKALFKVDFLNTAVFVAAVDSIDRAVRMQDEFLEACTRATLTHPDAESVCVVETHGDWPCVLYSRATMRPAFEPPTGAWVQPSPLLQGLGVIDTLWKHLDGAVDVWETSEPATRSDGPPNISDIAERHARDALTRMKKQGGRALQAAKKSAWTGLPDELGTRVSVFASAIAQGVPFDDALAGLQEEER